MRRIAALLAVLLTLALPASAMAAVTAPNTTESVTVNATLTATGVPATLDYPAVNPGDTTTAPTFKVTTSCSQACNLRATFSTLTLGSSTIPVTARNVHVVRDNGTYLCGGWDFPGSWDPAADLTTGTNVALAHRGASGNPCQWNITLAVHVPSDADSGAYGGTIAWTIGS